MNHPALAATSLEKRFVAEFYDSLQMVVELQKAIVQGRVFMIIYPAIAYLTASVFAVGAPGRTLPPSSAWDFLNI